MITTAAILSYINKLRLCFCVSIVLSGCIHSAQSQPPPPKPISVYNNPSQGLIFGAFFQGSSGGTVIVNHDGTRTVTGTLVAANLGYPYSAAVFEIDANTGTVVSIMNGPDITLTGSNGGSISLHIGAASTGATLITTAVSPSRTQVRVGGTLTVGTPASNPSGNYTGTFSVMFIQQ
ncbi:MAG: DUF4402 domain-containing protein [Agriterribacter sp.]